MMAVLMHCYGVCMMIATLALVENKNIFASICIIIATTIVCSVVDIHEKLIRRIELLEDTVNKGGDH